MKVGSLFSGGGLGDFGFLAAGMEIAWQCEIDEYCQKILALRYPESKKYTDIKTLKGADLEPVDIITGGFPCQPFSVAGKQKGKEDNRYLWPEMLRVIRECRPRWVIGENVPGIINLALDTVCADLEIEGYEVRPVVFPSHALGAWHKRDRLWIVANSDSGGLSRKRVCTQQQGGAKIERTGEIREECDVADATINARRERNGDCEDNVSNSESPRLQRREDGGNTKSKFSRLREGCRTIREYWESEPAVGRVANGIADRVQRLKMLGNGQVPACTYVIGKMIMDIEEDTK